MVFRRVLMFFLTVVLAGLTVSEAFAGGYSVPAVGTRARSMAGAFRAVADDWSAAYYNPAGLARIEQSQLSLSLNLDSRRPSFAPNVAVNGYNFGFPTEERYPDDMVAFYPDFSAVVPAPFGYPVTVSFSVFQPHDENVKWDLYRFPEGYGLSQGVLPNMEYRNNLDVVDFRAAIASSFAEDRLHLGLGFSIRRGDIHSSQMFLKPTPVADDRLNHRPYDYFATWSMIDVYGIGFGLNCGLLYDLNEYVSVGVGYQFKSTIKMDGKAVNQLYTADNRDIANLLGEWSQLEGLDSLYSGIRYRSEPEIETEMTLPSEIGIGIAVHPSEYVTLAADFALTRWSEFTDIEVDYITSHGLSKWSLINGLLTEHTRPYDWDDAIRISVGVEGQPGDNIKLRGGYSYDQSPVPDAQVSPLMAIPGDCHHLAGGISYFYERWEFAFAAELISMSKRDVDGLSDINDDGLWDNLPGSYKGTAFNTSFSVTLRF